MPLVLSPTGLPGPAAVSSASSSQPAWSPWLLRYQTPRVPKPARYHELDHLPCPLRRSAARVSGMNRVPATVSDRWMQHDLRAGPAVVTYRGTAAAVARGVASDPWQG